VLIRTGSESRSPDLFPPLAVCSPSLTSMDRASPRTKDETRVLYELCAVPEILSGESAASGASEPFLAAVRK